MNKLYSIGFFILILLTGCGGNGTGNNMTITSRLLASTTTVSADYKTIVQQLYISYFGRPADTGGLGSFQAQLAALGGPTDIQGLDQAYRSSDSIKSLVDSFGVSAESAALYSGDNTAFVTSIYINVLNRTPDSAGLAFWVGALNGGGVTRANASLSIMAGALINSSTQGKLDAALVNRKVTVGASFTDALIAAPINGYSGDAAAAQARAMLASVTAITDTTASQSMIAALVSKLATSQTANAAPVANAGLAQNVVTGTLVTLDGSGSSDANGDTLAYIWTLASKPAGSAATLAGATSAVPSFTADVAGTYVASLIVNDGEINSAASTLSITASGTNMFAVMAAGSYYSTALKSDGTVWTWGHNLYGSLGDGNRGYQTNDPNPNPGMVFGLTGVVAISAGDSHTVALKSDGTVVAWGKNSNGELGDGTSPNTRSTPVTVLGLVDVVAVSTGSVHSVALKSDGTVVTWGSNFKGQLGDGTTKDRLTPVAVPGLSGVIGVAAGSFFTMALKSDGTVWTWGDHAGGELSDGTVIDSLSPISIPGLSKVARVAAAANGGHRLALKTDGTVWSWGWNTLGPLGDGTMKNRWIPQAVQGLTGVLMLAAGDDYSVAVKSDGTVWAWGYNGLGQLGDGTKIHRFWPVAVGGLSGVVALAAGNAHTIAVKSDGTVWTWGYNASGQLGIGTTNPVMLLSPRAVGVAFNPFNLKN